jgi:hypothetical protein
VLWTLLIGSRVNWRSTPLPSCGRGPQADDARFGLEAIEIAMSSAEQINWVPIDRHFPFRPTGSLAKW